MRYFYARVSTKEQNLARQLEAAKSYSSAFDKVFSDKQSGKNFDRPEYQKMKSILVAGDEIVVKSLDRLSRNKDGIKEELKWFRDNDIIVRILDLPTTLIDFKGQEWIIDMVTNILIEVVASIAEQERETTLKRIHEGIAAMPVENGKRISSKTGNPMGRPISETSDIEKFLKKQKDGSMTVKDCCKELGISRTLWYNRIREVVV